MSIVRYGGRQPGKTDTSTPVPSTVFPGTNWATRTPAEAGLDSDELDNFETQIGSTAGFIAKDGYQVHTWGAYTTPIDYASGGKPLMSLLVLFALDDGEIASLTETITTHANVSWSFTGNDVNIHYQHLMSMQSGYAQDDDPGDTFGYNDYAIQLFGKTLQDLFAESDLSDELNARLTALGLEDGLTTTGGGYRSIISPRDYARIAWLFMNDFEWDGEQILPANYFSSYVTNMVADDQSITADETANDYLSIGTGGGGINQSDYGPNIYGFNTWFNNTVAETANRTWPSAPADAFCFDGHFGTELVIMFPSDNLIAAVKGNNQGFEPGTVDDGLDVAMKILAGAIL